MDDSEYMPPTSSGHLPRQDVFIGDQHTQAVSRSGGNKSLPTRTLSRFLHLGRKDENNEKQQDFLELPLSTAKHGNTTPSEHWNGCANGVVNPLSDHKLDDDTMSKMMNASQLSTSREDKGWWSERKRMLKYFSSEYIYLAGCHGVARGVQKDASWIRRLLWWLAVIAASSVLFYQCSLLIQQFQRYEFQVDVDFSFNRELAFPALTFCNLNPLKQSTLACSRFDSGCDRNATDVAIDYPTAGSIDLNTSLLDSIPDILANADAATLNVSQLDFSGQPITSQEYLRYGFLPEDMIISCTWNGEACGPSNFTVTPNPFYGNCFTLNGDTKKALFTNRPGPSAGLVLELFVDPFEGVGGETSSSSGVRMSLHQPGVKPFPEEDGFSLSTGFSTSIGVRQLEVSRLGSPYSNCTSNTDNWLSLYPGYSYSRTACVQSCLAQEMFEICGCVETFLVDKPICLNAKVNETQAECVASVRKSYRLGELGCDSCYNPCVDRIFLSALSLATWPASDYQFHFSAKLASQNISAQYAAPEVFREYFLRAEVYFEELNYQRIVQKPAYEAENLLADIGGQFGLWAGLSVLGLLELFDFSGKFFLILVGVIKVKM